MFDRLARVSGTKYFEPIRTSLTSRTRDARRTRQTASVGFIGSMCDIRTREAIERNTEECLLRLRRRRI